MTLFTNKEQCCGCGACAAICPKNAVVMTADEDGFVYPAVDDARCVDCGLCRKACAYQQPTASSVDEKQVYAASATDVDVSQSASGGMFATLASAVIRDGGAVYGCAMLYENDGLVPRHICAEDEETLVKLKGSKYVQSDLGDTYRAIKTRLTDGQTVLFSGTPCQVAGLKGFLGTSYDNLLTVDLICHGVPSAAFFRQYIAFEEEKRGGKITAFRFRDKSDGWKLRASMVVDGKTVTFEPEQSSYYQMFLNSYTYRINCYSCPYACDNRPGDITIGDYWCIDLVHPELLDDNGGELSEHRGVSCLIVNGENGKRWLDRCGGGIKRFVSAYDKAATYNRQLTAPSTLKPERDTVLTLARGEYAAVDKWYRRRLRPIKLKRAVRKAVPRPLKNLLKKLLGR